MAETKAAFIVHGFVQGKGYRYFVKGIAEKLGVKGIVKNQDDGSVLIIAEAEEGTLTEMERQINVSIKYGIEVMNIEMYYEGEAGFPKIDTDFDDFKILK